MHYFEESPKPGYDDFCWKIVHEDADNDLDNRCAWTREDHPSEVERTADQHRFMFEVWLNMYVTTTCYYKYGWEDHVPAVGDVVEITDKYRAAGIIKN